MIRVVTAFLFILGLVTPAAIAQSAQREQSQAYVFLEGDVKNPGRYALAPNMTVVELFELAGGLLPSAERIMVISATAKDASGKPAVETITVQKVKAATKEQPLPALKSGDRVMVRGR